tara:strand:+ start:441 stop:782 length:342 start_codon:yes stop_codon:yes gene_type:complete
LRELPEAIRKEGKDLSQLKRDRDIAVFNMKIIEQQLTQDINNEQTPKGAKKFGNAIARKIELDEQLGKHDNHIGYMGDADRLKSEIEEKTLHLEFLVNQFRSARSLSRLYGGD